MDKANRILFILRDLGIKDRGCRVRIKLYLMQNGKCHWCSCHTLLKKHNDPKQATIDHLKTRTQGRKNFSDGGYVMACGRCNWNRNKEEMKIRRKKFKTNASGFNRPSVKILKGPNDGV